MKNTTKISVQITLFIFLLAVIFFIIALFWYSNYTSLKDFLENFLNFKSISLIFLILFFSLIVGVFSKMIVCKIFKTIEINNKKLQDYNHYLAHELKTPISVIHSNLDVLEYGLDKNILHKSKQELKNMTQIIDSLLNYSETIRLESKTDINLENFLKSQIKFLDLELDIEIKNTLFNFSIYTDKVLFERVIKNLIDNAAKHSSDNALNIIILEDRLIFENNILKNLSSEELEKITQKFYSKSKNGTGIGLSIIGEILKVLNYSMKISSENEVFRAEIIY